MRVYARYACLLCYELLLLMWGPGVSACLHFGRFVFCFAHFRLSISLALGHNHIGPRVPGALPQGGVPGADLTQCTLRGGHLMMASARSTTHQAFCDIMPPGVHMMSQAAWCYTGPLNLQHLTAPSRRSPLDGWLRGEGSRECRACVRCAYILSYPILRASPSHGCNGGVSVNLPRRAQLRQNSIRAHL